MWVWLEIEPTTDKKSIKKAYAAQVKTCHREDDPERWKELHDAYQWALKYAERNKSARELLEREQPVAPKSIQNQQEKKQTMSPTDLTAQIRERQKAKPKMLPLIEKEQMSELDAVFTDIGKHGEEHKQFILDEICTRMWELTSKESVKYPEKWVAFLQSDRSVRMQAEEKYWSVFYSCLTQRELKVDVYQALSHELESIQRELGMQLSGEAKHSFLKCKNLCAEKVNRHKRKNGWKGILCIVALIAFRIIRIVMRYWNF